MADSFARCDYYIYLFSIIRGSKIPGKKGLRQIFGACEGIERCQINYSIQYIVLIFCQIPGVYLAVLLIVFAFWSFIDMGTNICWNKHYVFGDGLCSYFYFFDGSWTKVGIKYTDHSFIQFKHHRHFCGFVWNLDDQFNNTGFDREFINFKN